MARRMVWSPLRDDVQAGIDVDGIAGHPGGRAAYQERHLPSDLGDIHQPVRGRSADRGIDQFVELLDAAGGPGLQWPRRHGEYADAVLSQFRAKGPQLDRSAMGDAVFIGDADDQAAPSAQHVPDATIGLPRRW